MISFLCLLAGAIFTGYNELFKSEKVEKIKASSLVTKGDFFITVDNRWDDAAKRNFVEIGWGASSGLTNSGCRLLRSENAGANWTHQSMNYKKRIRVLNLFPDIYENNLKDWMDDPAVGLGLIDVTPVSITSFNSDPMSYLANAQGEYLYDAIFVGTADNNNNVALNAVAVDTLIAFVEAGRGLLMGHDTLSGNPQGWMGQTVDLTEMNRLAPYLGIDLRDQSAAGEGYPESTEIQLTNNGSLMKYPHEFENNQVFDIAGTHSFGQVAGSDHSGTIWSELKDPTSSGSGSFYDTPGSTANFYLVTKGNAGMIQTGHDNGSATLEEKKMIANTLYQLSQVSLEENVNDYAVTDDQAPGAPVIDIRCGSENGFDIRMDAKDKGKMYQWYVNAHTSSRVTKSDIRQEEVTSNIAGYFHRIVTDPNDPSLESFKTEVEGKKDTYGRIVESEFETDMYVAPNADTLSYPTGASFSVDQTQDLEEYLQVVAVDRMGNVSDVTTVQLKDLAQQVDFEIERTEDEASIVEVNLNNSLDRKMKSLEIQVSKNVDIDNFAGLTLPSQWYSFRNSGTTAYDSYSFSMESNNSIATIKSFLEQLNFNINAPVNTAGNIKIILHENLYTSWVDPEGVTHYYSFVPKIGTWMEAYNEAKMMRYRGLTGYLATLTSAEEHDFLYNNIGKTYGWLGGTRMRMTNPTTRRINDEIYIPTRIAEYTYDTSIAEDWYWADGPEAGQVFFDKPTYNVGGRTPPGMYSGFNNRDSNPGTSTFEPNNAASQEYCLQFAQASTTKYWNDMGHNATSYVAGFYVEFTEYGNQVEKEDVADVCWTAAIPQKISLKAYDDQGNALPEGDILYDQNLRIDAVITVIPEEIDFYTFIRVEDIADSPTVSSVYQEGKLIYSFRKANLHMRQVIINPKADLVVPSEGYAVIKNRLANAGNPIIDDNYQLAARISSDTLSNDPSFTPVVFSIGHLQDTSDEVRLSLIIPEFYKCTGYSLSSDEASHTSSPDSTDDVVTLTSQSLYDQSELWLTIYLEPSVTNDGSPQPYSWDYKHNDLGKIKTK